MKPHVFILASFLVYGVSGGQTVDDLLGNLTDVTSDITRGAPVPDKLKPFFNASAVEDIHKKNATEDWVIRDEDVAGEDEIQESFNQVTQDGEKTRITVSTQAGIQLYQHWLDQAVSGLMAAVATSKLKEVEREEKRAHRLCTKDAKTVSAHAKCVAMLLDAAERKKDEPIREKSKELVRSPPMKIKKVSKFVSKSAEKKRKQKKKTNKIKYRKPKRIDFSKSRSRESSSSWKGSFRSKREIPTRKVINKDSYKLQHRLNVSPFTLMARKLTEAVRSFKNKDRDTKGWKDTLVEIQEEGKKLKQKEKVKKMFKKRMELFTKSINDVGVDADAALDALDMGMYKDDVESERDEMKKEAKEMEKKLTPEQKMMREPIKLIREGVKLGLAMSGKNVSDFDDKTLKMISPKIMSLVPDEEDNRNNTLNLLSPSLFSLHNESGPHEHFSLSKVIGALGKGSEDEWMNFVFEASGVSDAVQYMKQIRAKEEREELLKQQTAPDGKPLYFTRENITQEYGEFEGQRADHMTKLHSMFSQQQYDKLNQTGYVSLSPQQLEFLYGPKSPYNDTQALNRFQNITEDDQKSAIEHTVRALAKDEIAFKAQRKKDLVLSPILLTAFINNPAAVSQALVLSPILLAPLIQSPAVFGSVILSPWVFVPVILSPRVLGPVVLSPILFAPVILSPLALVPVILSPGVFLPFVLSPFVLSPFILSPVAMAPIILSPFALSPFILVPNLMSPMILSPFVLSPLILSPPAISAFVLNPYALSPVIKSDGFAFTAVLSPSWLS